MRKTLIGASVMILLALSVAAQKLEPPKLEPTPSTESQTRLIKEGVDLHDKGDYDGAIARYLEVIRENPNNVMALYEISFSYYKKKDFQKSIEVSYQAAKFKSELIGAIYSQLGNCYDAIGDSKKAIETYKEGIKLRPEDALLRYNLAITYHAMGKSEDARAAAKRSAALNPNHTSSQILLSTLFEEGGYKTPSLLAACRFLILEPGSRRSDAALKIVEKVMQAGVSRESENKINIFVDSSAQKKDEGDFGAIEMFMGLARATNYTEKTRTRARFS